MKASLLAAAILTLGISASLARTWTSSDGAKTFEGTLRSYDPTTGVVTVVMEGGRALEFTQDKLSAADIAFLKESGNSTESSEAPMVDTESELGKLVAKAKLHRLEGERFKKAEIDKAPEYYILYFSASW